MADSDSIQLALSTIEKINQVKRQMRSMAQSCARTLSEVDSVIVNPAKLDILEDGLAGLGVDKNELNTEKSSLQAVCQNNLDNVPELTS